MKRSIVITACSLALGLIYSQSYAFNETSDEKSPREEYWESPLFAKHNGIEDFVLERCRHEDYFYSDSGGRKIVRRFIGLRLDYIDKEIMVATRFNQESTRAKLDTWPRYNFFLPVHDVTVLLSNDDSFVWGFRCSANSGNCIRVRFNPETGPDQWNEQDSVAFRCPKANEVVNAISDFMNDVPAEENPYAD